MAILRRDLENAFRRLRRDQSVAGFVVLTLALGIGANAAVFTAVDRLVLRGPEGIRDANRVFRVYHTESEGGGTSTSSALDFPAFVGLRDRMRAFEHVALYASMPATIGRGLTAKHAVAEYVSGDFFATLGTQALRGRLLDQGDDLNAGVHPIVISSALWERMFARAAAAVGQSILLDDRPYVIVGIAPRAFAGPDAGRVDVWLPVTVLGERLGPDWRSSWDAQWATVIGRLSPAATVSEAGTEATNIFRSLYAGADRATARSTLSLASLTHNTRGEWAPESFVAMSIMAVALLVLVMALANAASLLMARETRQRTETAVRLALGATPRDIGRLNILEALILGVASVAMATFVASALTWVIRSVLLPDVSWPEDAVDGRIIITGLVGFAGAVVALSLVRARTARRIDLGAELRETSQRSTRHGSPSQTTLAIAQCALSVVLLVGTGLFLRSIIAARDIDYGVDTGVTVVSVEWPRVWAASTRDAAAREWERRMTLLTAAAERLRSDPSVAFASVSMGLPFRGSATAPVAIASGGQVLQPSPAFFAVDSWFFPTIGTRVRSGRGFMPSDGSRTQRVAVVSQALADRLWPGRNPIHQCLFVGSAATECTRVVGVADNIRDFHGSTRGVYYIPISQTPLHQTALIDVRARGDAKISAVHIRSLLLSIDRDIDFVDVRKLGEYVDPQIRPWKLGSILFGVMAALALFTATVGLFGLAAHNAAARRKEFGIRRALGAGAVRLTLLMLKVTGIPVAVGLILGVSASMLLSRLLVHFLFSPRVNDPSVYGVVIATLTLAGLIAATLPALRLNRSSPANALRAE